MYSLLQYKEFTDEIKNIWKGQASPPATSGLKVSMEFDPTTVKLQDDVKVEVSGAAASTGQATSPGTAPPPGICCNNEVNVDYRCFTAHKYSNKQVGTIRLLA